MKVINTIQSINYPNKTYKVYRIHSNLLPLFRGICIPYIGIFVKRRYETDWILLEHESIHMDQFKRMGILMYILRYITQLIFIGYDTMPMELEARQTDSSLWSYRKRNWKNE